MSLLRGDTHEVADLRTRFRPSLLRRANAGLPPSPWPGPDGFRYAMYPLSMFTPTLRGGPYSRRHVWSDPRGAFDIPYPFPRWIPQLGAGISEFGISSIGIAG